MTGTGPVTVYGATGHTGRLLVAELRRRGIPVIPSGRDATRLRTAWPAAETRAAATDDAAALDRALAGAAAVVNCAGPFAVTAQPVLAAALRARIPYVDVAAEIEANAAMFTEYAPAARTAGVPVVPAMAFYGGLGDLLTTAALGDATTAQAVHIAYGLSGWHPTEGTLEAGRVSATRRGGRRLRHTGGALRLHDDPVVRRDWDFPAPLGRRTVIADFTMADVVTVPSHIEVPEVHTHMSVEAADDLAGTDAPAGERGRRPETFTVDVVVTAGGRDHRATAHGRDIYAITAPLAAEAVTRILAGDTRVTGVASAGAMYDAPAFLRALAPDLTVALPH